MAKYALTFPELEKSMRYVLIGLSYYSFHYDLSQSVNRNRVQYYYPFTGTMHHFALRAETAALYKSCSQEFQKILYPNHSEMLYQILKGSINDPIDWTKEYAFDSLSIEQQLEEVNIIKKDFNKN